jgi:glutamate--cysteine ligase
MAAELTMSLDRAFEKRLAGVINARARGVLQGGLKGVERESLRVTPTGQISKAPHPRALGSALTNEHVTTDYSEALIELVTPPFAHTWELVQYLADLHHFVYTNLPDDELLWATSMPCAIKGEASIPIAKFGSSNVGRMKTVYRQGLGHRYGRVMQAIAGVHFNYSFPDHFWPVLADVLRPRDSGQAFRSEAYFSLLRNYRRHGWIVLYLFGNSPALCPSFLQGRKVDGLEPLAPGSLYAPYATSLRMSDLGYRNKSQAGLNVSVNSLDQYVSDLTAAISTPNPEYEKIVTRSGERPTRALQRAGVQYVEMRSLDVSVFDPVGVNQNKLRFLEAFAAFCVLRDSHPIENSEQDELDGNHAIVAREGRRPGLLLRRAGRAVSLSDWAAEIIDSMRGLCELLDEGDAQRPYLTALELQEEKIHDVTRTPAARSLHEMRTNEESFFHFALRMSKVHQSYFKDLLPPNSSRQEEFAAEAAASIEQQARIEAADTVSFDEYLARYFAA